MKTIDLKIKNPILFATSNHYKAQTPHISYIIDTLSLDNNKFETCSEYGESWDFWEDMKDLEVKITPFGIQWKWQSRDDEGGYHKISCGFDYDACSIQGVMFLDDSVMLDDWMMERIGQDAKGLQKAIEIANM